MTDETIQIIPAGTDLQVVTPSADAKASLKTVIAKLVERAKSAGETARVKVETARGKVAPVADQVTGMVKGNVDAVSVAGKTLGAGLKEIGQGSVADGRQAIQTVVADVKEMAALRSAKEIVALQRSVAARNLASIKGFAAKNGTALRALANEALSPLGERLQANLSTLRKKAA